MPLADQDPALWDAAGLEALDALANDPRLGDYQPYWAARPGLR